MNRLIPLFAMKVFILSLSLPGFSQQKPTNVATGLQTKITTSESDIAAIRAEYTRINLLPLKPESFKFESPGCVDGGLITYLKSKGNIVKITNSGSIGDGSWTTESYFSSGKLIFYFDSLTGGAAAEKVTTTEYRLYIKNDRPMRCMEGKKIVQPGSKAMESIQTAYRLLKAYKSKDFTAALCDQ